MHTDPILRQPRLRDRVLLRAAVERAVRQWFADTGAVEISTPTLVPSPGMEPQLRAFEIAPTEAHELGRRWLHTSPEYAIKAALADLECDVFTLARSFRDEPPGRWHHAEFTMLEWYRAGDRLELLMRDCEALVIGAVAAATELFGAAARPMSVGAPFAVHRCDALFADLAGIDLSETDDARFAAAAITAGVDVQPDWDWDSVFTVVYADVIEPGLGRLGAPAFVTAFPARQAALARLETDDPRWASRFELYLPGHRVFGGEVGGIELANAFFELTDAGEQRARMERESAWRAQHGRPVYPMPEPLLSGIARMRDTVGIALGVERLLVWVAEEVLGWPTSVSSWLVSEPLSTPARSLGG